MGHNFSAVHGVKSENFYQQGNAINEIWIGDLELIARLPFGDSDLGQAGWPARNWPKIPWHQFVIPLKRDMDSYDSTVYAVNGTIDKVCECNDRSAVVPLTPAKTTSFYLLFNFGSWLTILGISLFYSVLFSSSLYNLHNGMVAARRLDPSAEWRQWMERLGLEHIRTLPAIVIWLCRFLWTQVPSLIGGLVLLAMGIPLLCFTLGHVIMSDYFVGQVFLNVIVVGLLLVILFMYKVWDIRRTLLNLRVRLEMPEPPQEADKATSEV